MSIAIYRREGVAVPKLTAADKRAIQDRLAECRVARPGLVKFLTSAQFRNLKAAPSAIINAPWNRCRAEQEGTVGRWIYTNESIRATKGDDNSTRQSIVLYVKRWLPEVADAVSVTLDDW